MNHFQAFKVAPVALAISAALSLSACSPEGNDNPIVSSDEVIINNEASANTSNVQIFITLPQRVQTLSADMEVILTIGDQNSLLEASAEDYRATVALAFNQNFPVYVRVQRRQDALLIASAQTSVSTTAGNLTVALPPQLFTTEFDADSDGFTNIVEIERGSDPLGVSEDFDGDGIANESDLDDDNDGVFDINDAFPLNAAESVDTDGDGIGNNQDHDDDNDSVLDVDDKFPLDANESLDLDLDGLGNSVDNDDDGDGTIDLEDPQPANPNITGNEDSDGDGIRDLEDAFPYNPAETNDVDGDGIGDNEDLDDNNNGILDDQDQAVVNIPFSTISPVIDGAYDWWEWSAATNANSRGTYLNINNLLIDNLGIETDQDPYKYSRWRAMHDGEYLYVLIIVDREPLPERWSDSADVWHDDSAELFFDIGNEQSSHYDHNDYQRLFRYQDDADDAQTDGANSASGMVSNYCSSRGMATEFSQEIYYEIRVHMASIGLQEGEPFGIDVQFNDDDTAGDRDAKWGWFALPGTDESWRDPSGLGTAIISPNRPLTDPVD